MGLIGKSKQPANKYRSQSAERYLDQNPRSMPNYGDDRQKVYGTYSPPLQRNYQPSALGYGPPPHSANTHPQARDHPSSVLGYGPQRPPPNGPHGGSLFGGYMGDAPEEPRTQDNAWHPAHNPRWEKEQKKMLQKYQKEQQKMLKQRQKEDEKRMKMQQEQMKLDQQEAQLKKIYEDQMMKFKEEQIQLQKEHDKQVMLFQSFVALQEQHEELLQQQQLQHQQLQHQQLQQQPIYDYSTLPNLNSELVPLDPYAYAYWSSFFQQLPYLNYTLPRVDEQPKKPRKERKRKERESRPKYKKNKQSEEVTLVTEENRISDSEQSSELFDSQSDEEISQADDFKNQLLAQKNKLKETKNDPTADNNKGEQGQPKISKNQPIFMAELQKKLNDKRKKPDSEEDKQETQNMPPAFEAIYGDPSALYGYIPGAPIPTASFVPQAPAMPTYIAPGAPQPETGNNDELEAMQLLKNMNINPVNNIQQENGPVLPLAKPTEDIYDDGKSAIYAIPQKKRADNNLTTIQGTLTEATEENYEEQASQLVIDDGDDEDNFDPVAKISSRPDDMMSAIYTAGHDGNEAIYATNDDVYAGGEAVGGEHEEEARINLENEADPPPARGADDLGVWREDHGTSRSPPPSYFAHVPDQMIDNRPPGRPYGRNQGNKNKKRGRRPPPKRRPNRPGQNNPHGNRQHAQRPNNKSCVIQ